MLYLVDGQGIVIKFRYRDRSTDATSRAGYRRRAKLLSGPISAGLSGAAMQGWNNVYAGGTAGLPCTTANCRPDASHEAAQLIIWYALNDTTSLPSTQSSAVSLSFIFSLDHSH